MVVCRREFAHFYVLQVIQGCALDGHAAKYSRIYGWRLKQCCGLVFGRLLLL